ncbi:MAG: EamA family transporter, partial [Thermoleophilia bacterium]|nr:EamA family transporter [Thermoleophilia bacterium]
MRWNGSAGVHRIAGLSVANGSRTGTFIACLAYVVFLSSGLCWLLWIFALRSLPAGAAGMGTLAVPVVGVTAAWIQLGERPTRGIGVARDPR